MCFVLFVGTDKPLPLKEWRKEAPDVSVEILSQDQTGVRVHFSKPFVQYVGSTSGCGCNFPHWILNYNGEVPDIPPELIGAEQAASNDYNRQALVKLLKSEAAGSIELYGVWDGDWTEAPKRVEQISIDRMRERSFLLGEQVFYRVQL